MKILAYLGKQKSEDLSELLNNAMPAHEVVQVETMEKLLSWTPHYYSFIDMAFVDVTREDAEQACQFIQGYRRIPTILLIWQDEGEDEVDWETWLRLDIFGYLRLSRNSANLAVPHLNSMLRRLPGHENLVSAV